MATKVCYNYKLTRQAGDKNFSLLFRIQYLAVGCNLIVLNLYLALVTPRLFRECAFHHASY